MTRSGMIGLGLGGAVVAGWALLLRTDLGPTFALLGRSTLPRLLLQTWLDVGLFIVAHDAMHGSLAPGQPRCNDGFGRLCLLLYGGFSYDRLRAAHFRHHARPGQPGDPDFCPAAPDRFLPWCRQFFAQYLGLREVAGIGAIGIILIGLLRPSWPRLMLYWALPALASAVQLFYFGTFLPHRHRPAAFADQHRARSQDFPWVVSLLTCFHFGHHLEHHRNPAIPWWRLPGARADGRRRKPRDRFSPTRYPGRAL